MVPSITACEASLIERSLRVAQAERGWQTDIAAQCRNARPNQFTAVPVKLLNMVGVVLARVGGCLADSRDGLRSKEHELAANGVTWAADPAHDERLADELRQASQRRAAMSVQTQRATGQPANLVLFAGARVIGAPRAADRYPTLAVIDRARAEGWLGFAEDPDAVRLEHLARAMTEQFWSEMAWITGFVPERAFNLVCEALERERTAVAEKAPLAVITELAGEPVYPAAA